MGLAQVLRFPLTPVTFVKVLMFLYEKVVHPTCQDLCLYKHNLCNQAGEFPM